MGNEPSIDVQRRRKADRPAGRAEAPVRRTPGGGGGTGGSSGGGLPIPTGGKLGGCGGIIVLILVVAYYLLSGGLGGGQPSPDVTSEQAQPTEGSISESLPTNPPRPTRTANPGQTGQKWLVMLYQDADDQVLEQDIFMDLNEAERAGSTDRVTIVAQMDRFQGAFQGDGNWTSARRYLVSQDDDLNAIHSRMISDLGEVNMADGKTLVDFATWAMETYPADRYVLVLSDHGMGWPGGWSDPKPGGRDSGAAPLISALQGDHLYLSEIDQALGNIRQQTGIDKFDIVGMDACLMSQLEVYAALQPHAHYAVASEETEPALGWAYTAFLEKLVDNPDLDPAQLSAEVVNSYVDQDQRIQDDQARADYLRQGSPLGSFFGVTDIGASQLARQIGRDATLTAVDLDALPGLMSKFNDFAYQLQSEDQAPIASARNYAQSFTSVFGKDVPPSYIDLGHFVKLAARETGSQAIGQAESAVAQALNRVIVAEKHGSAKPGSTGIAIYFPNSTMYRSPYTGPQSYNEIASRFVKASLWDDFLAYHYNDLSFQPDAAEAVTPPSGSASRAPGAGNITVSNVTASKSTLTPGGTTRISAEISGKNIGYIYLLIGYYDRQSNSIAVVDTDFLESSDTRNLNGVYYPAWPQSDSFKINFDWDASLFSASDGGTSVLALFNPAAYGASAADAAYILKGTYTFADSGEQRYAQLFFIDGKLVRVLGYQGQDDTGTPAEISPATGDTFTILQKWMDLDSSGKITQVVYEPGDTLTFRSNSSFTWEAVYAPAGEYLVGFLAADQDGKITAGYTQVTVR